MKSKVWLWKVLFLITLSFIDQLGMGGVGHVWSTCEGGHEEGWRHSVAAIPKEKILDAIKTMEDDLELTHDGGFLPPSGELKPNSNDDDLEDSRDDPYYFEKEVSISTFKFVSDTFCGFQIFNYIICRLKQPFSGLCMKTYKKAI